VLEYVRVAVVPLPEAAVTFKTGGPVKRLICSLTTNVPACASLFDAKLMLKDRFLLPAVKTKLAPCRDVDVNMKSMSRYIRFSAYTIIAGRIVKKAGSVGDTTAIVAICST
jgi:hypothetical protein